VSLSLGQSQRTGDLVRDSYNHIAAGYDRAWTEHMRHLSLGMLDRLNVPAGAECLDLTCGTGSVTGELAARSGRPAVGVDASDGMLDVARAQYPQCKFVRDDVLGYLRRYRRAGVDVVTCAWGLGYSKPVSVIREMARILRPGGRVGIIDNSLLSLAEVLWASMKTFAEMPEALVHASHVRFLPHSSVLSAAMRMAGLGVQHAWDGRHTYHVPDGNAAIERLTATGAAAGFEFAAAEADRDRVFVRFAEIIAHHAADPGIPITHRYLAAVGARPCS